MRRRALALALVAGALLAGPPAVAQPAGAGQRAAITSIVKHAIFQDHLKSVIVLVRANGITVYSAAFGESMTGVLATTAMHFRNGAMAFTYMATMLLELVDAKRASLDEKLAKFFPGLPDASRISLKNLANMTSGYADYVYQPEVLRGTALDPFRQWTPEELIRIGVTKPMQFSPGTNWGYSHTNYVILGRVLEKITGMPLDRAMQRYILTPLHLGQTRSIGTPQIPEPVLHTFTSERRPDLGIPAGVPFYEESTFWNPSWTTAAGAVQTTDITDMAITMEAVGTGKLLSKKSFAAQVQPNLIGFGHHDPKCPACRPNTAAFNYGLGVVNVGPWITQTKSFAGNGASAGYLPAQHLSITVSTTLAPAAFDDTGNSASTSIALFSALADALAPRSLPARAP